MSVYDQAQGLRQITGPGAEPTGHPPQAGRRPPEGPTLAAGRLPPVLAVASGKGGVGKTFLAINLAFAMRDLGHRCLLVDLDWGLANVDVALGLLPRRHIGHVLAGECELSGALLEHEGVAILPNGCGQAELTRPSSERCAALLQALGTALPDRTLIIADTHPGIGERTLEVLRQARARVVVTSPEPTALTDTYALFKVLQGQPSRGPVGLIINQARSPADAHVAAYHLDRVARRFLGIGIDSWGTVLHDPEAVRAVANQRALLLAAPRARAARTLREIAGRIAALLDQSDDWFVTRQKTTI